MRIGTLFRTVEQDQEDEVAAIREQVRAARLEVVRKNHRWTEVAETSLVKRGPFLVLAETDELFQLRRGMIFEPARAAIGYVSEDTEIHYFVDRAGEIVFLERRPGVWSDIVAKKARRAVGAR
jgi:hypothetical protein